MNARLLIFVGITISACLFPLQIARAIDRYVSPEGAGMKDGSSRENAAPAVGDGLQHAWNAITHGGTLWLIPGEYKGARLRIVPGENQEIRSLAGLVEGAKRAVFVGDFDKNLPGKTGGHSITIVEAAGNWVVRDLDFRDVNTAVHLLGGNSHGKIQNVCVYGAREGFRFEGKGKAELPSANITVSDCVFEHFTKRGLRLLPGNRNIIIERCSADAGGKAWATEPFQMGFAVEEDCDEISFIDCVARGSYNDAGKKYWNGDGFCAEMAGTVRWTRCRAFDNTDGGWDTKAKLSVFVDCIALRNTRNIRVWGKATLENCLAAFPQSPKGTEGACIWSKGEVQLTRCTLVGSRPMECEDGGKATLEKSYVVTLPKADGERDGFPSNGTSVSGSEVVQSDAEGVKKLFVAPEREFEGEGEGDGFNRVSGDEGYRKKLK